MTQTAAVRSWCLGVTLPLILVAVLHQGLATEAPPTTTQTTTQTPAHTTAQTTAEPHKDPGRPEKGHYQVNNSSGAPCLLASMGLQINVTFNSKNKTVQKVVNIQPNVTKPSGTCEAERASLLLSMDAEKTNLTLVFALNTTTSKYHLSEVSLSAAWTGMDPFFAENRSLEYLRGTLGFSYMCHEEQTLNVTKDLSINTVKVQVQPFGVNGDQFGAAEECQLDEDDMLIPIIVGAALAGLVLIVLLAYLIGRKRSHAGYQTI